jgi:hypothetical protein
VLAILLTDTAPAPRAVAPKRPIPRAVEAAVVRAMAKNPAARFATAAAMREALEQARGAPVRLRQRAQRVAGAMLMGGAIVAAAVGSARWARGHAPALETAGAPSVSAPSALQAAAMPEPESPPPASERASRGQASASIPALAPTSTLSLREARARAHAHPGSPAALDAWTRAALRAGELREAHRGAMAWASRDSTVEPRLVMAEVLDASGRRPEATALLTEWLEAHPDAPDAADARAALSRLSSDAVARR